MRLLTWDELPSSLEPQRAALTLAAFSGAVERRTVEHLRGRPGGPPEYVGIFAVERGRLLGEALVLRIPYRTVHGVTTVAGIASVTTHASAARRGVARAILEEVHRRERAAGIEIALLWTSPSWFAHRLYETLGYRDVYTPSLAVRLLPRIAPRVRSDSLRPASTALLADLERLHAEVTRNAPGFSARPPAFLRTARRAGRPLTGLLTYRRGGRIAGYAVVLAERGQARCVELVAVPGEEERLLAAVERRVAPGLFVVGNSPADSLRRTLRRRGYFVSARGDWRTLMACPLGGARPPSVLRRELGVDRPDFVCQGLDRF
jgi:GNAT superfamily N-acetyltransferase